MVTVQGAIYGDCVQCATDHGVSIRSATDHGGSIQGATDHGGSIRSATDHGDSTGSYHATDQEVLFVCKMSPWISKI